MSGHTPGPWIAKCPPRDPNVLDVFTASGVKVHRGYWGYQADAHLIAAAPDLLAALKSLLAECGGLDDTRIAAEAAIAKAEGR